MIFVFLWKSEAQFWETKSHSNLTMVREDDGRIAQKEGIQGSKVRFFVGSPGYMFSSEQNI